VPPEEVPAPKRCPEEVPEASLRLRCAKRCREKVLLRRQRVDQMHGVAGLFESVDQPVPVEGGFDSDADQFSVSSITAR
jgi:hypothetical protein